jgi:hypothetical protein
MPHILFDLAAGTQVDSPASLDVGLLVPGLCSLNPLDVVMDESLIHHKSKVDVLNKILCYPAAHIRGPTIQSLPQVNGPTTI